MPRAARLSCVCSARVRLCSHHHHLPADTKFPILSQQREWKEGKRPRPEGGGQGRSWLLCPGASFQPRSGARPQPGLPREEQDSPRQAAAGAAGVGSLGLVQPPGTWESVRVTAPGAQAARRRSPGQQGVLEPGPVPTAAFLPPRESVLGAPLTVHFRPPGAQPGIPLPRPRHLEGRGSRDEGTPPLRWTPPPQLKRPAAVR